jgi:hypothetical protein
MRKLLTAAFIVALLPFMTWILAVKGQDASPQPPTESPAREAITLTISLYSLVDDLDDPDPEFSSKRTEDDLREILAGINDIWSQADIVFEPQFIGALAVPPIVLVEISRGNYANFLNAIQRDNIHLPDPGVFVGFYTKEVGGFNGITPYGIGSRTFFVDDEPTVFDRRVTSHELGHMLGLHHALDDEDRLLYSGTNGMTLTEEEIIVARYVAQGILDGVR